MIATSAKLRELLSIAEASATCSGEQGDDNCPGCTQDRAQSALEDAAPALARLVLELSEALERVNTDIARDTEEWGDCQGKDCPAQKNRYPFKPHDTTGCIWEQIKDALAGVEKLES
ncbi:MAG: hypothetical protein IH822_06330 [Chloroflexi bacterium]|nr:hypothetical protein [Chloroflexota bacterium]